MDNKPMIENKDSVEGPRKSKKLWILIGALLFLGIAGGGGFWGYRHFFAAKPDPAVKGAAKLEDKKVKAILALDPFLVNLADSGEIRFVKTTFQLGMAQEPAAEAHNTATVAAMRDSIISLLSSKTAEQILTVQGKEKLREEVRSRVNTIAPGLNVLEVYIVDFVIQL